MKKIFLAGWLLISFSGMAQQNESSGTQAPDEELVCPHGGWDCRDVASFGWDSDWSNAWNNKFDTEVNCTARILSDPDKVLGHIEDEEEKSQIMQNLEDCMQKYPERYFQSYRLPIF